MKNLKGHLIAIAVASVIFMLIGLFANACAYAFDYELGLHQCNFIDYISNNCN